jgi:hypothetical protein
VFPSSGITALQTACCGPVRENGVIWRELKIGAHELVAIGIAGQYISHVNLATMAHSPASEIADLPVASRRRMKGRGSIKRKTALKPWW